MLEQKYQTWKEASRAAIGLTVKTQREYGVRYSEDPRLPRNPQVYYRTKKGRGEFPNWNKFLGKDEWVPYESWQAAGTAAQRLQVKGERDYPTKRHLDTRLPSNPHVFYDRKYGREPFPGWQTFLGQEIHQNKRVKRYVRSCSPNEAKILLDKLPTSQRHLLHLADRECRPIGVISRELLMPRSTVNRQLSEARTLLWGYVVAEDKFDGTRVVVKSSNTIQLYPDKVFRLAALLMITREKVLQLTLSELKEKAKRNYRVLVRSSHPDLNRHWRNRGSRLQRIIVANKQIQSLQEDDLQLLIEYEVKLQKKRKHVPDFSLSFDLTSLVSSSLGWGYQEVVEEKY